MFTWVMIIAALVPAPGSATAHPHPRPAPVCRPSGPFIADPWLPPHWTHCTTTRPRGHHR